MNKKIIMGIIFLVAIIVIVLALINYKSNKIPEYDADIICFYSTKETLDEEEYDSKSIVYIYKDKDNVKKSIIQSIMSTNSDTRLLESIIGLFDNIEGIDASLSIMDDSIVFEVVYDFEELDLDLTKEYLGGILDESSILMNTSKLPISVDDYLDSLSNDYKCEVK